eukprot:776123-Pelagomonas_calceolata.AAC.5
MKTVSKGSMWLVISPRAQVRNQQERLGHLDKKPQTGSKGLKKISKVKVCNQQEMLGLLYRKNKPAPRRKHGSSRV